MHTRAIPGTNLAPSVICFGGGSLCRSDYRNEACDLLDLYEELGGSFIDTANVYGKWLPEATNISEQYIGHWLRSRNNRHRIVLATKGGHPHPATMQTPRLDRASIHQDLEESLRSLKTDVIDLYWLHRDDETMPVEEILGTMNDLVRSGKIRWFGCSNWRLPRIRASCEKAGEHKMQGFVADQLLWSLAEVRPGAIEDPTLVAMDAPLWQYHAEQRWTAVPYASQANGYFQKLAVSGKATIAPDLLKKYDTPTNDRRFEVLQNRVASGDGTLDELVLEYLLAQPFPVFPIIGARNAEQLRASMRAGTK